MNESIKKTIKFLLFSALTFGILRYVRNTKWSIDLECFILTTILTIIFISLDLVMPLVN